MSPTPTPLAVERLRRLALEPHGHSRGLGHLSAASGLVCTGGHAYVVADDEHHLAVYGHRSRPGTLYRMLDGDLPASNAARKRRKPDFEVLLPWHGCALMALGSGSQTSRDRAVIVPLDAHGKPRGGNRVIDLRALYEPLRECLGRINIEGAFVAGDTLHLLNRGHPSGASNVVLHYRLADVIDWMEGRRPGVAMQRVRPFDLGHIDGVALGFTDGAALPGGGWVFSAVAEDSRDSVADGTCRGAVVGTVSAGGHLQSLRRLATPDKVEGIDVQLRAEGLALFMVTDPDDPQQAAWLLSAWL